jgi:phenylpropionate dioxygenase-like ring-hydroxylating dioxygenase large terminal subunit
MSRGLRRLTNIDPALRGAWHPVARSQEVSDKPTCVLLIGEPWVLYREGGEVRAWPDRCPHRGAPLSLGSVEPGGLRCAYHGWLFDAGGGCADLPALGDGTPIPPRARLQPPGGVAERYGLVWLAPADPVTPLPDIDADIAGLERAELPTLETRAGAGLLADNFLDMAHFPFVHRNTFGAGESAVVVPYSVEREGWSFTVTYTHAFSNREDPGVAAGIRPLVQTRRMTYRYQAPFALLLCIDYLDAGGVNNIGFFIQPQDADHCRIYSMLWRNDLGGDPLVTKEVVAFELQVVEEDLALQSRFHDLSLPLDALGEVHTRADRITLELRRVLADLVAQATGLGN